MTAVIDNVKRHTISIGMPVYNGEKDLRRVLDSLCSQTFEDFDLTISDNASTDATAEICREYANEDDRIRYIRQAKNLGAAANFQYVLNEAHGPYFMWAAADDVRSPEFLELNYTFLEKNPAYVASTSPVKFDGNEFDPIKMGDASLTGNVADRVQEFFLTWHANSRFYSLMRTSTLKTCPYVGKEFLGSDWAVILYIISQGKTNRHSDGFIVLGREGASSLESIFANYRTSWLHWALPFWELNGVVLKISKNFPIRSKLNIFRSLIILNRLAAYRSLKIAVKTRLKLGSGGKESGSCDRST